MKYTQYLFILPAFVLLSAMIRQDHSRFDALVNTYKEECKKSIKPARYESSRVTYYALRREKQVKSVEVFFFTDREYIFALNGKIASVPVSAHFYDLPESSASRHLLKSVDITGKNVLVSSSELNHSYREKVPRSERLKKAYISYEIGGSEYAQEAIILVLGLK